MTRLYRDGFASEEALLEGLAPSWPGKRTLTQRLGGKVSRAATGPATDEASDRVAAARGQAGTGLPAGLRAQLERALGSSLDGVRLHTREPSQAAARSLGARAYAIGQDIHFGAGQYDPDSRAGQHLIAHEVAHTVQQRGGGEQLGTKLEVSGPGDAHELEADRFADAFIGGEAATVQPGTAAGAGAIARKGETDVKKDKEVEVNLGGGKKVKINLSNPEASLEVEAKSFPEEPLEKTQTFPVALCPGVFGYLAVGASAGISVSGKATIKGTASGPKDDPNWTFSVGGSASIKGEVKASVSLGLGAGVPGILAMRGEAAAIPTASLEAGPSITGTVAYTKGSPATAALDVDLKVSAELATEFALRVLYDVFWKKNPVEMGKFTIAKWTIATGSFGGKASYGAEGWKAGKIEPNIKWGSQPEATQTAGVPIGEHLGEYRKFQGPGGDGGGSGAPNHGADEVDENGDWIEPDDRALPDDGGGQEFVGPESDHGECRDPSAPADEPAAPAEAEEPQECVDPGMSQ